MCLDSILQKLGTKKPFLKNGRLSKSGTRAYNLLIDIISNIPLITDKLTNQQANKIIDDLDKIEYEN